MTKDTFNRICEELQIYPAIALESEQVRQALLNHEPEDKLKEILKNEF